MRLVREVAAGRVVIGKARPDDASAIVALHERVLAEDRWFITSADEFQGTEEWQRAVLEDTERRDNCLCLVARKDDRIAGVLTIQGGALRRMRHVGRLEVYVDSDARGGGVGRALLETAIRWAEDNAVLRKVSLVVFEDNVRAIALYESFGFRVEGRREGEYRERDGTLRGDLMMWKGV